jgi:hypothetical protein
MGDHKATYDSFIFCNDPLWNRILEDKPKPSNMRIFNDRTGFPHRPTFSGGLCMKQQSEQTSRGNPYRPSRLMLRLVPRLHHPRRPSGAPHWGRSAE